LHSSHFKNNSTYIFSEERPSKMPMQPRWAELRAKMQVIKDAYASRHYTQCAKYGEQMLAQLKGEVRSIPSLALTINHVY
jgi:hypothetical protein